VKYILGDLIFYTVMAIYIIAVARCFLKLVFLMKAPDLKLKNIEEKINEEKLVFKYRNLAE
jgi:hypothetical protein